MPSLALFAPGSLVRAPALLLTLTLFGCTARPPRPAVPESKLAPLGLAVEVENQSRPVLCAEEDNVAIAATSDAVRSFRIEAAPPVYAGMLRRDSTEPDWTACDMRADPAHAAQVPPRIETLYEDGQLQLIGHTLPTFWRPSTASVRIGERVEPGIHLLQLWLKTPTGPEEVLAVYPQDGYWRIRPRPLEGFGELAYGSSFLVGPVEHEGRPIVALRELAFEPATRAFRLAFARGGAGSVQVRELDGNRHVLTVRFDRPIAGRPFAMLRSMYITEFNNDVARIALREPGAPGWREEHVMGFESARATDVWMGRLTPSRHNTSSPDVVFSGFSESDEPRRPSSAAY